MRLVRSSAQALLPFGIHCDVMHCNERRYAVMRHGWHSTSAWCPLNMSHCNDSVVGSRWYTTFTKLESSDTVQICCKLSEPCEWPCMLWQCTDCCVWVRLWVAANQNGKLLATAQCRRKGTPMGGRILSCLVT